MSVDSNEHGFEGRTATVQNRPRSQTLESVLIETVGAMPVGGEAPPPPQWHRWLCIVNDAPAKSDDADQVIRSDSNNFCNNHDGEKIASSPVLLCCLLRRLLICYRG